MSWISAGGSRSIDASIAAATAGKICSRGVVNEFADSATLPEKLPIVNVVLLYDQVVAVVFMVVPNTSAVPVTEQLLFNDKAKLMSEAGIDVPMHGEATVAV